MKTLNIFLVATLMIAIPQSIFSQINSGLIKGKLLDSVGKKALSLATVTVFKASDTTIVTYRLTDDKGEFKVPGLPLNIKCRVLISFSGYGTFRKEFELSKDSSQVDFGNVILSNDPKMLDEVFVQAERPPVSIRKDTIEFNASAFKTLPSALLEDLLKKLPGIDIDPNGNITVNGKQVNRLLVDGKEFFGGDPKIATKNLPANIVDKVQVMDDKEQLERNPDISAADVGQVVNIKLKKSIKQGWFGKAYAGVGTNSRHEAGAIVNAFKDTTQISLITYSNNINKPGFGITDLQKIGGFDRSGTNSMMVSSDGGFAINGVSFGGLGQGIQHSMGGGANFNHQFRKKVTLNLQYFYGQTNSDYESLTNRQRFFKDTTQIVRSNSINENVNFSHRIGGTIIWKVDSFTTVTFRPGLTLSNDRTDRHSNTAISDNFRGPLNSEDNTQRSLGDGSIYSQSLFINKLFRKKGRILTLNNYMDVSSNVTDQYFDLINTFYVDPAIIYSNQLRKRETSNLISNLNVSFTEPLSKTTSLRVGNNVELNNESNYLSPYNKNTSSGKYVDLIDSINSGLERDLWRNTTSAGLTWRKNKFNIQGALNFLMLSYNNEYLKSFPVDRRYTYVYPNISVDYNGMRLGYSANVRAPSAFELQPIIDNTNRQFLQYGNPTLKPVYSQSLSFNIFKSKPTGSSYSINMNGSITDNAVMRENIVNSAGIQTSRPVNVNGLKGAFLSGSYSKQYKFNTNYRLSLRPSIFGSYNESIVSFNGNRSGSNTVGYNTSLNLNFSYKEKIELNNRYSYNKRFTRYDNTKYFRNIDVTTHSAESEIVVRMPKHFVWENLINYSYNSQVAPGIRKSVVRWNAGLNYLFLKEDKGNLKLSIFDLLNQNVSVSRYTTENSIFDSQTTTLRRYFMLSFIYNLRTFSPGKVGGKDRGFFIF